MKNILLKVSSYLEINYFNQMFARNLVTFINSPINLKLYNKTCLKETYSFVTFKFEVTLPHVAQAM